MRSVRRSSAKRLPRRRRFAPHGRSEGDTARARVSLAHATRRATGEVSKAEKNCGADDTFLSRCEPRSVFPWQLHAFPAVFPVACNDSRSPCLLRPSPFVHPPPRTRGSRPELTISRPLRGPIAVLLIAFRLSPVACRSRLVPDRQVLRIPHRTCDVLFEVDERALVGVSFLHGAANDGAGDRVRAVANDR